MKMQTVAVKALAFAAGALMVFVSVQSAGAKQIDIKIENMKLNPEEIAAAPGDVIVWKNLDIVPHTVTAVEKRKGKPKFDSHQLDKDKEFRLTVKESTYGDYACSFHPMMKGKIIKPKH
jgi:plastocyanin